MNEKMGRRREGITTLLIMPLSGDKRKKKGRIGRKSE